MNQANVAALRDALVEWAPKSEAGRTLAFEADMIARFLAARGVLVPAALTDEDFGGLAERECLIVPGVAHLAPLLERIAKGEDA